MDRRDAQELPPGGLTRTLHVCRRCLRVLLLAVVLAYGAMLGLLYSLQAELIFPGKVTQGRTSPPSELPDGVELVWLTGPAGERIAALHGAPLTPEGRPHPDSGGRPTILYFYGNGMSLRDVGGDLESFRRLGAGVLIPEYLGYGLSEGRAGEAGCYATADAAYAYLTERKGVAPERILAAGWSLGGAVAIDLASRKRVAGLAAFSTFSSIGEMASRQYPFFPVTLLLRHRFESAGKIGRVRCPILLCHGEQDRLIPVAMAERLAAAAGGPVTRLAIPDADHNDLFDVGGESLRGAFRKFLARL